MALLRPPAERPEMDARHLFWLPRLQECPLRPDRGARDGERLFARRHLPAKELAECRGILVPSRDCRLHVDHRPGATEADYERLAQEVRRAVGIDISLEGIYYWILFPSSKMDPLLPTANRYVGWYTNNEIKIRGVEIRRRDTPVFIKRLQGEMLKMMGRPARWGRLQPAPGNPCHGGEFLRVLRAGHADPLELVVRRHLSREAEEYANRAQMRTSPGHWRRRMHLPPANGGVHPGRCNGKRDPDKAKPVALYAFEDGYDIAKYTEMALKAVETLLLPFGYDVEALKQHWHIVKPAKRASRKLPPRGGELTLFTPEEQRQAG